MEPLTDIQIKFEKLPAVIREAITSVDFAEKLQNIGKDNNLHLDELDALFEEVGFVMLGETRTQDFAPKIASRLSLRSDQVAPLVKSVDEEIFRPIRTALISLHDNEPRRVTDIPLPTASSPSYVPPVPKVAPAPEPRVTPTPINEPVKVNVSSFTPSAPTINPIYNDSSIGTAIPSTPQPLGDGVVVTPEINALNEEAPSREHLLSNIEDRPTEDEDSLIPHRQLESQDPHTYLLGKEDLLKKITGAGGTAVPTPPTLKKRSLAEEAVLIAQKKASPAALSMESIIAAAPSMPKTTTPEKTPLTPSSTTPTLTIETLEGVDKEIPPLKIIPEAMPAETTLPTPTIVSAAPAPSLTPEKKLTGVVQTPRTITEVHGELTATPIVSTTTPGKTVDPYREPI